MTNQLGTSTPPSSPRASSKFRTDINGLRAWAVVAVVLYHFGVPGFNGGFVGVDIFFVISGFLMTGIVVAGLESAKGFSVWQFYMARARRIIPALIVLCAVLLVLGWWFLTSIDYKPLSKQIVSSLGFVSNISFWREAGYFDGASHEKWLLHTWSLAVEWQFYMLLPLVLMVAWKLRPNRTAINVVMILGLLASLALSVLLTPIKPTAAFFLLPTRAWEMMAGGLVYLFANSLTLNNRQAIAVEVAGFLLIIGAIVGFDTASSWPGWRALVPVLGAMLLIFAARPYSPLLGHSIAQWLGTRSYSLYLWHWPIVVTLVFLRAEDKPLYIAVGLLVTLIIGHFSYLWVETPSREGLTKLPSSAGAAAILGVAILVALPSMWVLHKNGVMGRISPTIELVAGEQNDKNRRMDACFAKSGIQSPSCMYGGAQLKAILIGDSHANAITTALAAAIPNTDDGIMEWTYEACPTLRGVHEDQGKCGEFVEWAIKKLNDVPKEVPLVIANRTSVYALGHNEKGDASPNKPLVYFDRPYATATPEFLAEFTRRLVDTSCLLAKDRPVYMMRPIPEMGIDVPKTMSRSMIAGQTVDISISLDEYRHRHDFIWAAQDAAHEKCGIKILDPLPYLCTDGYCHGSKDGKPLYYDDDHLSEFGNKLLVPMFTEVFTI